MTDKAPYPGQPSVYTVDEKDWDELHELSRIAAETPVIRVGSYCVSTSARERVERKWRQIADQLDIIYSTIRPYNEGRREILAVPRKRRKDPTHC